MVLESLVSPLKAEKKPWKMFFIGILYSSVAIIVSIILFQQFASLVMIFFTVMASIPIIYLTIKMEEEKDLEINDEKLLIKEHGKALAFFMFLFLGFVVSFTVWNILLPGGLSEKVFEIQTNTIAEINDPLTGNAVNFGGAFLEIFLNNFKVLLFCLIFAFFYGFGAIFILTWNASVIGTAIGNIVKANFGYISILPLALLKFLIHGVPEILAYFMAGLAGGIISIAVIKHDFNSKNFKRILLDSADLTIGAVVLLIIAALLEIFVSPMIL